MRGKKTGGRKKGVPNKVTADLKEAVLRAFDEVGGVSYLATVARENPAAFCALLGKVLPRQISGDLGVSGDLGTRLDQAMRRLSASASEPVH